jgi:hypothetical protein
MKTLRSLMFQKKFANCHWMFSAPIPPFRIFINGHPFSLDSLKAAAFSQRVRQSISDGIGHLSIGPAVSSVAADTFIATLNGKEFELTNETAVPLLSLATDLKVPSVVRLLTKEGQSMIVCVIWQFTSMLTLRMIACRRWVSRSSSGCFGRPIFR